MIKTIDLTKTYRGKPAVDHLNLSVEKGQIFGFLGPNGAGKTTTVKMLAGVLKPSKGRIIIDGIDMAKNPTAAKRIMGYIPDRPYLYEKLSAAEFLEMISGLYGLAQNSDVKQRIDHLLNLFELSSWRDELIESYSHGMRQRLVMCSALLYGPKVIVVDEPMVGLDPRGARLVKEIFSKEAAKGTTIFMSTHSLEVAEELCDQIGIINKGHLIACGTPEQLRAKAGVDGRLEQVFLKLTEERQ